MIKKQNEQASEHQAAILELNTATKEYEEIYLFTGYYGMRGNVQNFLQKEARLKAVLSRPHYLDLTHLQH